MLQGDNAQGKTNLLEAIYFLATTKSPRTANDAELIRWDAFAEGEPVSRLEAQVQRASGKLEVEIAMRGTQGGAKEQEPGQDLGPEEGTSFLAPHRPILVQKRLRVNGVARRAADFIGQVNVVLFSPEDIELVGGSPALRRRYLDITYCQVDRTYLRALQRYGRVLLQRNHLLRQIREEPHRADELAIWDEQLVDLGLYLVQQRAKGLRELDDLSRMVHHRVTNGREDLRLVYLPSVGQNLGPWAEELEEARNEFRRALAEYRGREIAQGMSLVGPHRDDLRFVVNGFDMGVYGSRGQQRTVALCLRLAEAQFVHQRKQDWPILLLDDILSELDASRRRHVLEVAKQHQQVLITTTDLDRLTPDFLARATCLRILEGRLEPWSLDVLR